MAQRPSLKRAAARAGQAPADHGRLHGPAGLVVAPFAADETAGERKLIRAAVVLAKHLNRLIRRRFTVAVSVFLPEREAQAPRSRSAPSSCAPCLSLGINRKPHRANEVSVWYRSCRAPAPRNLM